MKRLRSIPGGTRGAAVAISLVLALAVACGKRAPKSPDWVTSAPAASVMGLSGQAGWIIEQKGFQTLIEKYPLADQTLDIFLKKAHINPHQESGHISFYVLSFPGTKQASGEAKAIPSFLIQLGGFKDQEAVHMAIADAFPSEGSLALGKRELPVYVILDWNQYHVRAVADADGRIWLGELRSLAALDSGNFPARHPVTSAMEWINGKAPFQGYIRVKPILNDISGNVPEDLARNLPQGIEALAWSVTPGPAGKDSLHRFELAITGSPEGVVQVAPWVQRFVAAVSSLQGSQGAQAPEILQEKQRIGVRCQLTGEQINQALAKLSQPGISFLPRKP